MDDEPVRGGGGAFFARVAAGVFALVAIAGGIAAIAIALGLGSREPLDLQLAVRGGATAANAKSADPFAWKPSRSAEFERQAALGSSHVIYEKSPGGVVASAERTDKWRSQIEAAAKAHGADPDMLEAVIFLESAGRPDVIAGPTPESAAGLAQIIPSTATDLLGMSVDLPQSIALTNKIKHSRSPQQTDRLQAQRAQIDQRFDPDAAINGAARYLEIAQQRFGDPELAVVSYHMGIGNLESVLRAYAGDDSDQPIGDLVKSADLSYPRVFFDSAPDTHRKAYELLAGFGDESSLYLWKVLASKDILSQWRDDPDTLAATAQLATNKATLEEVYHPANETPVFAEPDDIKNATDDGRPRPPPRRPRSRLGAGSRHRPVRLAARPVAGALPRAEAGGAGDADLHRRRGAQPQRLGDAAAGDERGPRPDLPGPARAEQSTGDRGVLASHHRVGVRRSPRLRLWPSGTGISVRPRPAARARGDRLRGRAGGDSHHRFG